MTSTHLHVNYVLNMRAHAYRDGNTGRFLYLKINALLAIGGRLNDCSMKHYIVLNIALFSHAHVTISAEINLTHACSRGEASRSNCHSRLRAFVGMASRNWETVLKV